MDHRKLIKDALLYNWARYQAWNSTQKKNGLVAAIVIAHSLDPKEFQAIKAELATSLSLFKKEHPALLTRSRTRRKGDVAFIINRKKIESREARSWKEIHRIDKQRPGILQPFYIEIPSAKGASESLHQQLSHLDETTTLKKKALLFQRPQVSSQINPWQDDGALELDDVFHHTLQVCQSVLAATPTSTESPRLGRDNLPLGFSIEVTDPGLCDVIQGVLELESATLCSFIFSDKAAFEAFIQENKQDQNKRVNCICLPEGERITREPLNAYLKANSFQGLVLDYVCGTPLAIRYIAALPGALLPVADSLTRINHEELAGQGIIHYIFNMSLYCHGGPGCEDQHRLHFEEEFEGPDGWMVFSGCRHQPKLESLHFPERASLLSELRKIEPIQF